MSATPAGTTAKANLQDTSGKANSGGELKTVQKYQKRIYAKACLVCRARKVKCLNPESPPCAQCKQGGYVCEVSDGPRTGSGSTGGAQRVNASTRGTSDAADIDSPSHGAGPTVERVVRRTEDGRAVKRSRVSSTALSVHDDMPDNLLALGQGSGRGAEGKGHRLDLEARVRRIESYLWSNGRGESGEHMEDVGDVGGDTSPLHGYQVRKPHPGPHYSSRRDSHSRMDDAEAEKAGYSDGRHIVDEEHAYEEDALQAAASAEHTKTHPHRPHIRSRTSHLRMKREHLEHPRYSLGPLGQASYHGETSLFDDFQGTGSGSGGGMEEGLGSAGTRSAAAAHRQPSHLLDHSSSLPSPLHSHLHAHLRPHMHLGGVSGSASPSSFALLQQGQDDEELAQEERLRVARRARHRYATPEEGEAYMEAHFCWASQTYGVVSRPLLLRDMATNGPYFSQLLLLVLYLSGIRFTTSLNEAEREAKSERYFDIFMGLLMVEMRKPTRITTIQALLAVAGRQCAVGKSNEGWLYTGMAIRMMQDMGIHLPLDETSSSRFSAEEREMRTRLYWSAYNWDKTLALTLGREPALILRSGHSPDKITDESDDGSPWIPFFNGVISPVPNYPSAATHTIRVLRYSSRLNMILESILLNMYSPERPNARSLSFVRSAHERLDEFWAQLPRDLRMEKGNMPDVCPPSNGILLNLLYQVQFILLYRPLLSSSHQSASIAATSLDICRGAAITAHEIFTMWGRTFGFVNMVYLMMYCCFVCAGVDVILLRVGNDGIKQEALGRVLLGLEILEAASSQGPGIRQGIATIRSQLDRATRGEFAAPPTHPTQPGVASAGSVAQISAGDVSMRSVSATDLPQAPMPSLSLDNIAPRSLLHRRTAQQSHIRDGGSGGTAPQSAWTGVGAVATSAPVHVNGYDSQGVALQSSNPAELLTLFAGSNDAATATTPLQTDQAPDADEQQATMTSGMPQAMAATGDANDFSNWFDSVNLVDLLGELPVSSEDPFGFGTDWGGWQT